MHGSISGKAFSTLNTPRDELQAFGSADNKTNLSRRHFAREMRRNGYFRVEVIFENKSMPGDPRR